MNVRCALLGVPAALVAIVICQASSALARDGFSSAEGSALAAIAEKGMT
jgi:hypothetical protein